MYGYENWTIKKSEHWRIDAFELWCWRRLLRVSWAAKEIKPVNREGNQPWIFIGKTDAEAEIPILGPPDAKSQLIGKDLDAGKDWGQEKGWQRMRWLNGITDSMTWVWASSRRRWTGRPAVLQSMGSQRIGHNRTTNPEQILILERSFWFHRSDCLKGELEGISWQSGG